MTTDEQPPSPRDFQSWSDPLMRHIAAHQLAAFMCEDIASRIADGRETRESATTKMRTLYERWKGSDEVERDAAVEVLDWLEAEARKQEKTDTE